MRFIVSHFGSAAVRIVNDEVAPPLGFPSKGIIDSIVQRYAFVGRPPDAPELQGHQAINFQSGGFTFEEKRVAVIGISLVAHGDIVFAPTTNIAERVLDDLIGHLESEFGFRYSSAKQTRIYQSNVTVEFNMDLAEKISGLKNFQTFIGKRIARPDRSFQLKRLSLGSGDVPNPLVNTQPTLEILEQSDFMIERRAGAPYESNRYFSSAPMRTEDHLKLLEQIEDEHF
jgi:hypothetical protein